MVVAGSYAIWYGRWELAVYDGQLSDDPIVDRIESMRLRVVAEIQRIGATQLVLLAAAITIGVIVWSHIRHDPEPRPDSTDANRADLPPSPPRGRALADLDERNASERL